MSMSSRLMERATLLWKRGERAQAHKIFASIIHNDRGNEAAWIWYIYTLESNREKITALENFLLIFPGHVTAQKALNSLKEEIGPPPPEQKTPVDDISRVASAAPAPRRAVTVERNNRSGVVPWVIMALGLCIFLFSFARINSRYNALQADNKSLTTSNQILSQDLEKLRSNYKALEYNHSQLTGEYNSLTIQYNALNNEFSILSNTYTSLYAEHNELVDRFNTLSGDYNTLNDIAIKPPYIVVHDRMVDTTFYDTDGELITWTTPFAGLEYGIEHGSYMRGRIVDDEWQTTHVHTEDGTSLWLRDFSVFVTPDTFENVIPQLYEKSSSPYDFIYRIWYMVGQLSNYASEDTETPRYSLETLLAGGGDCEDLSILFASLIKAAPVDWYVDLVYVDSTNINNPQDPDHVVVYIDTGWETYIVETTSDQYMLPYPNGITGWLANSLQSGNDELYPVYLH